MSFPVGKSWMLALVFKVPAVASVFLCICMFGFCSRMKDKSKAVNLTLMLVHGVCVSYFVLSLFSHQFVC